VGLLSYICGGVCMGRKYLALEYKKGSGDFIRVIHKSDGKDPKLEQKPTPLYKDKGVRIYAAVVGAPHEKQKAT